MHLGSGYSVEAQVTGEDIVGGLQFVVIPSSQPSRPPPYVKPSISVANYPALSLGIETLRKKSVLLQSASRFTTTVEDLTIMIQEAEGIPPDQQRLISLTRQLQDGKYCNTHMDKPLAYPPPGLTLQESEIPDVGMPSLP